MTKLVNQLVTPQQLLIEKTALDCAAVFYEAGRSAGLTSKYTNPRDFAKRYVERFIPMALECLIELLSKPHIPQDQKDLIYDAIMERANDLELKTLSTGILDNNNPDWKPDWLKPDRTPITVKSELEKVLDKGIRSLDYYGEENESKGNASGGNIIAESNSIQANES